MATITTVVRWADNTADLARNLKEGLNQIEATRASVDKLVKSLSGEKLIAAAHRSVAAISEIGGATKLTASEAERNFSLIDRAIQKMELTSQTVPESMRAMRTELEAVATAAKHTDDTTTSMGLSFGKLVAGLVSAQAILALVRKGFDLVVGGITDSIKAAGEAEKAHVQLVAALRAQGTALPSVISAYQGYATALQKTTIYQDDALESAAALLVTIGNVMPRDMEKALKATTNLASGLGIDLDTAARTVAKAAEGNTTALRKVGVIMDETKGKTHDFGDVLDAITAKFGGQAEAIAGTYQGRLAQLANTWNNVEESVGRVITQNATVLEAFKLLNEAIDANTGELNGNQAINEIVSDTVIATAKAFSVLIEAVDLTQSAYQTLRIVSNEVVKAFLNIGIAALDTATAIGTYTKYVNPVAWTQMWKNGMREIAESSAFLKGAVQGLTADSASAATSSNVWSERIAVLDQRIGGFTSSLEKTRGKTNELKDVTDGAANAWDRHTVAVGKTSDALEKALPLLQSSALGFKVYIEDTSKLTAIVPNMTAHIEETASAFAQARSEMDDLASHELILNRVESDTGAILGGTVIPLFSMLPNVVAQGTKAIKDATAATQTFAQRIGTGLVDVLAKIPSVVVQAFTGGGGLTGAMAGIGSMVGASLGKSIGAGIKLLGKGLGPLGEAIGSLAGPLIQWIASLFDHSEQDVKRLAAGYGVSIGKDIADAIKKSMETLHLSQQGATIINADLLFPKVDAGNLGQAIKITHDVFSMIQTGQLSVAQGAEVLDKMWPKLQKAGTDAYGFIGASLKELIRLDKEFGTHSEAIAAFVKAQTDDIASGFNAVAAAADGSVDSIARMGRLADVAFTAAIKNGAGLLGAIDAIGPGLDALSEAMNKSGTEASGLFAQLLVFRQFAKDNAALVAGIDGLNKMMTGLANTGMLTQDVFADLTATAFDFYQKSIAGGLSSTQAMVAMQPTLQRIWQLHKDVGLAVDANTQGLLDEAEANGIVGDQMRSVNEQILGVLKAIAKVLGADLPAAMNQFVNSVPDNPFGDWQLPRARDFSFDVPDEPARAHSGAMVMADGIQTFHKGTAKVLPFIRAHSGLMPGEVPAILQTGEAVLNRGAVDAVGTDAIAAMNAGRSIGPNGGAPPIIVNDYSRFFEVKALDTRSIKDALDAAGYDTIDDIEDFRKGKNQRWRRAIGGLPRAS